VGRINKNTAVVLIGGSMVMVDPWFEGVPAVVMAYYPGVQGGLATTRVLFGDVNPSGKIPFVIPHQESDLPQVDWLADEQVYGYYHGYAKLDKEGIQPKLPFGHGLSYTTFELSGSQLKSNLAGVAIFEVEVKNVGTCAGGEVVQLYSGWNGSSVDRPVKRLQDFAKAYLQPGECKRLTLAVAKADLAYYDGNTRAWVEEDLEYTAFIGTDANQASMNTITFRYA
jgi:beta-glucosidase